MRISINLATKPFVELRPLLLRLRTLMAVLLVVAVSLAVGSHLLQTHLDTAQTKMDSLKARTTAAVTEKQANERRMRQPANAAVLDRAHFLNALFLRKSFSWTAVMMDLEQVLPTGVQVTSIVPQVAADGSVGIRLRVAGDRDRAVLLVRNLERSHRFIQPRLTGETVQTKDASRQGGPPIGAGAATGGVEFEILAEYNPLPEGESYTKADEAKPDDEAGSSKPVGANAAAHSHLAGAAGPKTAAKGARR